MEFLSRDSVCIWFGPTAYFATLLQSDPTRVLATVSEAEQARYRATVSRRAGLDFLFGRYMLRHALSATISDRVAPPDWALVINENGKPGLLNSPCEAPGFSISHSDGMVAVALGWGEQLGLDIERVDQPPPPLHRLLDKSQLAQLTTLPSVVRENWLLRVWCINEAVSKAFGLGLLLPFGELTWEPDARGAHWQRGHWRSGGAFRYRLCQLGKRHQLCVALAPPLPPDCALPDLVLIPFHPERFLGGAKPVC